MQIKGQVMKRSGDECQAVRSGYEAMSLAAAASLNNDPEALRSRIP